MKIAHYDTGDIKDPLGVIHDEIGAPILEPSELILAKEDDVRSWISKSKTNKKWSGFLAKIIFDEAGKGCFYRTNKRLIYIRDPQPMQHLKRGGTMGIPVSIAYVGWAKEWKRLGRRECFSVELKDIKGYDRGWGGIHFYILLTEGVFAGRKCTLHIPTKQVVVDNLFGEFLGYLDQKKGEKIN